MFEFKKAGRLTELEVMWF